MDQKHDAGEVTELLFAIRAGDPRAGARLLDLVMVELRRMAARIMTREREGHTLRPTALVNELYLHLLSTNPPEIRDRAHFFALSAQAMRRILVDYARASKSQKRGGSWQRVDIDLISPAAVSSAQEVLELDQALEQLKKRDERQCLVVELRYFAGLGEEEIAEMLDISTRTVKRDWAMAKAWLHGELVK